jgi:aminomethyltransferase
VQHVTCNDASKLIDGQAQYSGLMTPTGTFVDDLLVHRLSAEHYLLCVNAGNQDHDFDHIREHNRFGAMLENAGERYSQLSIQGPATVKILEQLSDVALASLKYYHFTFGQIVNVPCLIARTGYTGEDGFELYFSPEDSEEVWNYLLEEGTPLGMRPCGLGARNTLRLEAAMALYGHEIDETTTPWEARLGWICKMEKGGFLGRDALAAQKQKGITRALIGFEMQDRLIARDGCAVWIGGREAGRVTSGSPAPYLKKNIGMAYVPVESSAPGTELAIAIRANQAPARVVPVPFYKRPR